MPSHRLSSSTHRDFRSRRTTSLASHESPRRVESSQRVLQYASPYKRFRAKFLAQGSVKNLSSHSSPNNCTPKHLGKSRNNMAFNKGGRKRGPDLSESPTPERPTKQIKIEDVDDTVKKSPAAKHISYIDLTSDDDEPLITHTQKIAPLNKHVSAPSTLPKPTPDFSGANHTMPTKKETEPKPEQKFESAADEIAALKVLLAEREAELLQVRREKDAETQKAHGLQFALDQKIHEEYAASSLAQRLMEEVDELKKARDDLEDEDYDERQKNANLQAELYQKCEYIRELEENAESLERTSDSLDAQVGKMGAQISEATDLLTADEDPNTPNGPHDTIVDKVGYMMDKYEKTIKDLQAELDDATLPPSPASSTEFGGDEQMKMKNMQMLYKRIKQRSDTFLSVSKRLLDTTAGLDLDRIGELGQCMKDLKAAVRKVESDTGRVGN